MGSICQLTSGHGLDDERILHRMARTAARHGYRSVVAGPGGVSTRWPDVECIALPGRTGPVTHPRRWWACLAVTWWALRRRFDILQLHDPDLLPAGLLLKLFGRAVVYDVHEDYQAKLWDRLATRTWLRAWVPRLWWWFEQRAARAFDGVIVADRHLARKFADVKPLILGNYPPLEFACQGEKPKDGTFNLLYVGGVTRARGLGVLAEALRRLPHPEMRLDVVGDAHDADVLAALCEDRRVVLHGRVPWHELQRFYHRAHVGVALYQPLAGFLTVDHSSKIIEYMASGLAVVTSDFPALRELVDGNRIGLTVRPNDPDAVASAIEALFADSALRQSYGFAGRALFESSLHWERFSHELADLYHRIVAGALP